MAGGLGSGLGLGSGSGGGWTGGGHLPPEINTRKPFSRPCSTNLPWTSSTTTKKTGAGALFPFMFLLLAATQHLQWWGVGCGGSDAAGQPLVVFKAAKRGPVPGVSNLGFFLWCHLPWHLRGPV